MNYYPFKLAWAVLVAWLSTATCAAADLPLIPFGSTWKYLDNGSNQGTAWRATTFNDAGWASGPAELGYGDGDEATVVSFGPNASSKYITTYFRKTINIPNVNAHLGYALRIKRDDGVIIYLNGTEVMRQNFGEGSISSSALSYAAVNSSEEDQLLQHLLTPAQFLNGNNTLAVEIHQNAGNSSDLSFDLELLGLDATAEVHRGPYLHIATPTGMTIAWTTNVPTNSRVRYGTSPTTLDQVIDLPAVALHHEVALAGLLPATTYYYAIGSTTQDLTPGESSTFFTTHPSTGSEQPFRIWVIGDAGTGTIAQTAVRNSYLNFIAGSRKADAWLMLGDNAYGHGRVSEYQIGLFHDMYEPILRNTPMWPAPGNHDYYCGANAATSTGPYYELFALPRSGQSGGVASNTEAYYSFDLGNVHFISLDSYGVSLSTVGAMATWLQADLNYARANAKWIIAYWHHPPYSKGSHNSDLVSDSGGLMRDMRQNIVPILEQGGVDLVLTGHSHSYERSFLIDGHYGVSSSFIPATMGKDMTSGRASSTGAYEKPADPSAHAGAVYTVCGVSGQATASGALNHPVMYLSTYSHLGSMIIDVHADTLNARFINDAGSVIDHFDMLKPRSSILTSIRMALQGPFDAATGLMRDPLRTLPSFPLTEPYSALFPRNGGGETISPSVLSIEGPSAIVDWILVELRDKTTPSQVLASRAGLLRRDGLIVDVDGTSPLAFAAAVGDYHIAVRHRNHLGAMTAVPLRVNRIPLILDLRAPATQTWGTDARCNDAGTMVLWSGDVRKDGAVIYTGTGNDRDPILETIGGVIPTNEVDGYLGTDPSMDGSTLYTGNGNDRDRVLFTIGGTVPTSIRTEQIP